MAAKYSVCRTIVRRIFDVRNERACKTFLSKGGETLLCCDRARHSEANSILHFTTPYTPIYGVF